ncbi:MAG: hypothetical protein BGP06_09505 [Rhizobiales bacterium 65-9]|nr:MAG: hypothetical protein BGP06_09505 [Rhizobiales bacterium 65-9]
MPVTYSHSVHSGSGADDFGLFLITQSDGPQAEFGMELELSSYSQAIAEAKRITALPRKEVMLFELGEYNSGRGSVTDFVLIWWTEGVEGIGRPNDGRGRGFCFEDGVQLPVRYRSPSREAIRAFKNGDLTEDHVACFDAPPVRIDADDDDDHYVKVHCDVCGLKIPFNKAHTYSHEKAVGRSSGSTSVTYERTGSNLLGFTHRPVRTQHSGETFYETEELTMCQSCYDSQKSSDFWKTAVEWVAGGIVIVIFLIMFMRK